MNPSSIPSLAAALLAKGFPVEIKLVVSYSSEGLESPPPVTPTNMLSKFVFSKLKTSWGEGGRGVRRRGGGSSQVMDGCTK